jgi:hypothetical protein
VTAPGDLTAAVGASNRIDLAWSAVPNNQGYEIERSDNGGVWWGTIGVAETGATGFQDMNGVWPGTTYTYRVRAWNPAGYGPYSEWVTITLGTPPAPPAPAAAPMATSQLQISWSDVNNDAGYKVERSPNGTTGWVQVGTTPSNVTIFVNTGLTADTKYFYRVRGTNVIGNGAYSAVTSATTLAVPPVRVADVSFGGAQRSVIRAIDVTFTGEVTITPGAFELTKVGGAAITVNAATQVVAGQTVARLTFADGTDASDSLLDGRYTLTVRSDHVTGIDGFPLDGDGDGVIGGNSVTAFHRLAGDADGDADVDATDFGAFRAAFGTASAVFDFDGDGDVDAGDFGTFRQRFGASV